MLSHRKNESEPVAESTERLGLMNLCMALKVCHPPNCQTRVFFD
jgi:hypothetical protein